MLKAICSSGVWWAAMAAAAIAADPVFIPCSAPPEQYGKPYDCGDVVLINPDEKGFNLVPVDDPNASGRRCWKATIDGKNGNDRIFLPDPNDPKNPDKVKPTDKFYKWAFCQGLYIKLKRPNKDGLRQCEIRIVPNWQLTDVANVTIQSVDEISSSRPSHLFFRSAVNGNPVKDYTQLGFGLIGPKNADQAENDLCAIVNVSGRLKIQDGN